MPNLLLTRRCVRQCPYCFAQDYMSESGQDVLRWEDYIYVLDFFERSRISVLSLMGGEPTLHPDFILMAQYALRRGFKLRLFTSGILSNEVRHSLVQLIGRYDQDDAIHLIVNVNEPTLTSEAHRAAQAALLEVCPTRISISFNLYRVNFDLGFVFDLIERYGLIRKLRLGLAHPIALAAQPNTFISPSNYREVTRNLDRCLPLFETQQITPEFDCGFPICAFADEQLGRLVKLGASFNWICGPIVDIGPTLDVWPCFPLAQLGSQSLYDFDNFVELRQHFAAAIARQLDAQRKIYPECDGCAAPTRKLCGGGCVAYQIQRGTNRA